MKTKFLGGTGFCTSHSFAISASAISKWDVRKHVPPIARLAALGWVAAIICSNGAQAASGQFPFRRDGQLMMAQVRINDAEPSIVGMKTLRRFIITFDAPQGRMYLEPTPAFSEPVSAPP